MTEQSEISPQVKVMIAGIGGASLGTEIFKALHLAGGYEVYGCDISSTAYGHYQEGFAKTYLVNRNNYILDVIRACKESGASFLIPGGEQPMVLLGEGRDELAFHGIDLLANSPEVIRTCSDKKATFDLLKECMVNIPKTIALDNKDDLDYVGLPCIVKPATGSGGSVAVFFAVTSEEAMAYAEFIRRSGSVAIAQEYISADDGEFTIGVLSLPDKQVIGSIALRRTFDAKLSVAYRGRGGLISSGYSQGYIGHCPNLCAQAEKIALAVGSQGPLNIQARVRDGVLIPFEINPRFSASTYLRTMAGFNEVDMLIRHRITGKAPSRPAIKSGWYLRSLTEQFVPDEKIK